MPARTGPRRACAALGAAMAAALALGAARPAAAGLWVLRTHRCPQVMGSEPWAGLEVLRDDGRGALVDVAPAELLAQAAGRPLVVVIPGDRLAGPLAVGVGSWSRRWLIQHRAIPAGAAVAVLDWPGHQLYVDPARDVAEKQRRADIAGYHLARLLQSLPAGGRVCLVGHSSGGRIAASALHLLGGGALSCLDGDPPVRLTAARPDLHLRAVLIGASIDRTWLAPGERFDRALWACEAMLNLYNPRDRVLILYPLSRRSEHRAALGRAGLREADRARLGPLAARLDERAIDGLIGGRHSLAETIAEPDVGRLIAPYAWAAGPGLLPWDRAGYR